MIPGFNHNVKYKGRVFHCQTEDSGIGNPHIITHLFVGGNILATKKTSYADIVKADRLEEVVTELMKEQHKELIKKLVSGSFDDSIEARSQGASMLNGPAPLNVDAGSQNRASMLAMPGVEMPVAPKKAAPKTALSGAPAEGATAATAPSQQARPATTAPPLEVAGPGPTPVAKPQTGKVAPIAASAALVPQEVLDAANLQRAQKQPEPSRPASGTIFGEDLISEKSLDEVILSYLADETNR